MNKISIFCILISLSFGNFATTGKDYDFDKDAYPFENEIKEELFYSLLLERKEKSTTIKIAKIIRGKISISFFMIFEFYLSLPTYSQ